MKLIIVGPPGSGKGTQSLRMSRALGIPHISTGASLRHAIELGTPLGEAACECVAAGHLVPDELVTELVHERLGQPRARERGFLLDGFPRNQAQLDVVLGWLDPGTLDAAIELAVPHDIVVQRLVGRARTDDTEAGIRERLRAFEHDTVPMIRDLDQRGLLISVDADRAPHEVTSDILGALRAPARSAGSAASS